jgi:hypothetical protein
MVCTRDHSGLGFDFRVRHLNTIIKILQALFKIDPIFIEKLKSRFKTSRVMCSLNVL